LGHVLLDNRHGLVVNTCVTAATGTAEWDAAEMLLAGRRGGTVGGNKNYDVRRFVHTVRAQGLTPHVAAKRRFSAIDRRTTRHAGYAESQRRRKRVLTKCAPLAEQSSAMLTPSDGVSLEPVANLLPSGRAADAPRIMCNLIVQRYSRKSRPPAP
jgi:hypothetical protein